MNPNNQKLWDELRAGYQPQTPELDVASIMSAIRQEAAAHPLRRAEPSSVNAIPTWVCAMAASLAILAAVGVIGRSVTTADRTISQAWMQNIEPEQFEEDILSFTSTVREGSEI